MSIYREKLLQMFHLQFVMQIKRFNFLSVYKNFYFTAVTANKWVLNTTQLIQTFSSDFDTGEKIPTTS